MHCMQKRRLVLYTNLSLNNITVEAMREGVAYKSTTSSYIWEWGCVLSHRKSVSLVTAINHTNREKCVQLVPQILLPTNLHSLPFKMTHGGGGLGPLYDRTNGSCIIGKEEALKYLRHRPVTKPSSLCLLGVGTGRGGLTFWHRHCAGWWVLLCTTGSSPFLVLETKQMAWNSMFTLYHSPFNQRG